MSSLSALKSSILSKKTKNSSQSQPDDAEPVSASSLLALAASHEDTAERYGMSGPRARRGLEAAWDVYSGQLLADLFGWTVLGRAPNASGDRDAKLTFDALYNAARTVELLATFSDPPTLPISHRLDMLEVSLLLSELAIRTVSARSPETPMEKIVALANLADGHYNCAAGLRSLADEMEGSEVGAEGVAPVTIGRGLAFSVEQPRTLVSAGKSKADMLKLATGHLEKVYQVQEQRLALEAAERQTLANQPETEPSEPETDDGDQMDETDRSSNAASEEELDVLYPLTAPTMLDTLLTLFSTRTDIVELLPSEGPESNDLIAKQSELGARIEEALTSIPENSRGNLGTIWTLYKSQLGILIPSHRSAAQKALMDLVTDLSKAYPPDLDVLLPALTELADSLMEDRADGLAVASNVVIELLEKAHKLRPRDVGILTSLTDAKVLLFTAPRTEGANTAADTQILSTAVAEYSKALAILNVDLAKLSTPASARPSARRGQEPQTLPDPRSLDLMDRVLLITQHISPADFRTLLRAPTYKEHGGSARGFVNGPGSEDVMEIRTHVGGAAPWVRAELQL